MQRFLSELSALCRFLIIISVLIHEAENYAQEIGIQHILFHVEKSNTEAFRLYERLGYKIFRDDGNRYMMKKMRFILRRNALLQKNMLIF